MVIVTVDCQSTNRHNRKGAPSYKVQAYLAEFDLVGGWATSLKNMSSSIGMIIIPNSNGKIKLMATKPPTSKWVTHAETTHITELRYHRVISYLGPQGSSTTPIHHMGIAAFLDPKEVPRHRSIQWAWDGMGHTLHVS